jgi:ubiquinone biosynthesis protein
MQRCPVADFFRSEGAADVCAGTWCTQDFALAELWGGALELTGTLAGGAERCDFRFRSASRS